MATIKVPPRFLAESALKVLKGKIEKGELTGFDFATDESKDVIKGTEKIVICKFTFRESGGD